MATAALGLSGTATEGQFSDTTSALENLHLIPGEADLAEIETTLRDALEAVRAHLTPA